MTECGRDDRETDIGPRRLVVKVGSALVTNEGRGLDSKSIALWVDEIVQLVDADFEVVLVSSGSIAEGMQRLNWSVRPEAIHELQAAAAVGQMGLIQLYEVCFQRHNKRTAQVLFTHDDIESRQRYLNARSTLRTLLELGVVPVVNENDTVSTDEVKFGDNDTLAALAANLVEAEHLIILTDQEGLYTADPRIVADARLVTDGRAGDPELNRMAGEGSTYGRGGMRTKLRAAELAARSGTTTTIACGRQADVLKRIMAGERVGTRLSPAQAPLAARKRWMAGQVQTRGTLTIDAGAAQVLARDGRSLLAVGVQRVTGNFSRGALVTCVQANGTEVARGLVNYSASEIKRISGQPSERIVSLLGYVAEPELIHRDNMVVLT
jgi:glutamate 5-kinase